MILTKITKAYLLSAMMMGAMSTALPAVSANAAVIKQQKSEKEWLLLGSRDGVTCYYQVGPLGTCNNAVLLKVVNHSAAAVIVDFSVETDGVAVSKKITVAAGQTIDPSSDSSLSIRPVSSGKPVVSFTVSK
jgi:hypothetical protein